MPDRGYKILLIDQEIQILESLKVSLEKSGFDIRIAMHGEEGIELARQFHPNLVILEINLPKMDGIEVCSEVKSNEEFKNSFIIFYTGRNEDYSQVAAFNAGADDYIIKPAKTQVILARVNALLKRLTGKEKNKSEKNGASVIIDRDAYKVIKRGEELTFPRKEFELLALLHSTPGKIFSRQEISFRIWGHEIPTGNRTIDVHIRKLRQKLGDLHIKTFKGVGYSFEY